MFSVFWLGFGVPMTPEVKKNTPWGPPEAPGNPPLGGLIIMRRLSINGANIIGRLARR